jgi:hypothetical protein
LEIIDIFNAVLDEKGLGKAGQLELAHAAVKLSEHRFEYGVAFGVGAGGLGVNLRHEDKEREKSSENDHGARAERVH